MKTKTVVQSGSRSPNWRGGRSVASNGYVLIKVGVDHHLADVRGYAYEHRLVAEKKIGRRLLPGEHAHQVNGMKTDNRDENIEVVTVREHRFKHRSEKTRDRLRKPDEPNTEVNCACGCGAAFDRYDSSGRPRLYVTGHNPANAWVQPAIVEALREGPRSRTDLAKSLETTVGSVACGLSRLRKLGLVTPLGGGRWEAA